MESDPIQDAVHDLQGRVAFMDDLLDELNRLVARQQEQIAALQREVFQLRQQGEASGSGAPFRSLRDELPPHY
jgi:SlyX protein